MSADSIIGKISVGDGATFTPSVNSAGELSWTNNKNLPNPEPFDVPGAVIDSGAMTPGSRNGTIAFGGNDVAVTGWGTKANVASPAFTGTPTAPTPTAGDNSTKIATTEFVNAKAAEYLPLSGGTLTGDVNGVTPPAGDNSTKIATTEFVNAKAGNYLPLSGGTITGVVNGVTPPAGDNSTKIATTEFVNAKAGNYLPLSGGTITGVVNGVTPPAGDNSKKLANTEFIQALANILVPTGCVQAYARNSTPQGWLLCDGSAVSRTAYAALYAVIGTTYGAGNGSTTFNLPNLVDKFVEGSVMAGTVKSAGLPNITGEIYNQGGLMNITDQSAGAFKTTQIPGPVLAGASSGSYGYGRTTTFDASRSSSIYGNSATVQPPALTMRYIIKY